MYLKHYQLKQEPFPPRPDKQIFFPGGGREVVLQHLLKDLSDAMSLIHLSGEKGSGKTLMCQLIQEKIQRTQAVALLSGSSGTINGKNLAASEKNTKNQTGNKLYEKILRLITDRADNDDSILLIIDDAEKLPPSLLTQILRLASEAQPQRKVQFILAGRLTLGVNPELFTAIRAEPLQQFTYTLQPLDRDDTARYLHFRLIRAGLPEDKKESIFSHEAISKIHDATCGNISMINTLAEEALHNAYRDKSLTVFTDHVKFPSELSSTLPLSISLPSGPVKTSRKILAGLIVLIIIASFWVYNVVPTDSKSKQQTEEPDVDPQEVSSSLAENFPTSSLTQSEPSLLPVFESEDEDNTQTFTKQNPKIKTTQDEKAKIIFLTANKTEKLIASPPTQVQQSLALVISQKTDKDVQILAKKNSEDKTKIVLLTPDTTLKVRHQLGGEKKQTNDNLSPRLTPQELYNKRTIAGELWLKGEKNTLYTLQLMALQAKNAETNMKQMLSQKRYRQYADNFFIFRKMTEPETVFVFYGEYKSIDAARQAQRSIPDFLEAHQPYAISIKEAMGKLQN